MAFFRKTPPATPAADGWFKCPACREIVSRPAWLPNLRVCPRCGRHDPLPPAERIAAVADPGSFEEWDANLKPLDFLGFPAPAPYRDRLDSAAAATGRPDALVTGAAAVLGRPVALAVFDAAFLDATISSAAGERLARAAERAAALRLPLLLFAPSCEPRAAEGTLDLLQPAKIAAALQALAAQRLPFLAVLVPPCDLSAPPPFAQSADLLLAEGPASAPPPRGIDQLVPRALLRDRLAAVLALLCGPLPANA